MDRKSIEDLVIEKEERQKPLAHITMSNDNSILINGHTYEIMQNQNNCFDLKDFINRYNPIFSRYSYIVGDYGYGSLRLKGFTEDGSKSNLQNQFIAIQDYLYEYANMGANYFVLHNLEVNTKIKRNNSHGRRKSKRPFRSKHRPFIKIKSYDVTLNRKDNVTSVKSKGHGKQRFTIKQKEY